MSGVGAVHLVVGEEEFLAERATAAVIAAVRAQASDPDAVPVTRMRAGDATDPELAELLSPSLFAEDRIVIVEAADQAGKAPARLIVDSAANPPDGITLIIVHSGGGRTKAMVGEVKKLGATVHECPQVKWPNERADFAKAEFGRHQVKVSSAVVETLVEAVRADLRDIAAAVAQLVADTGGKVDVDAVHTYYAGRAEVTGFEIAEKAVTGDAAGAREALRWAQHRGVPQVLVADALAEAIHDIAMVGPRLSRSKFDLAKELGIAPFRVEKAQRAARGWGTAQVAEAIEVVAALNADVKGQAADADYSLERAVDAMCALARS